jgi:D-glycero-D-manno-heptose 1,7-bisphosphate phosphatase
LGRDEEDEGANHMKRPAVFLDRDGTVNEQMGYINHISRFVLLPGSAEAIKLLNENDRLAIIITNQSGVGRGYFPVEFVDKVHARMAELLEKEGAKIDHIFICPHHPDEGCDCRKPKTGLIQKACETLDIDMDKSYVIGDRCSDMEFAHRSNMKSILVKTGYGLGEKEFILPGSTFKPAHIADDLLDAVRWIINNDKTI